MRFERLRPVIRVVSLFCGIGAADLGLYAAARELGIEVEVVAAIDSWDKAVAVYNANLPHPVARVADVKTLAAADLPPHDLVIGGPPCQPFSLAGKRAGHGDPRNCLPDFIRLAAGTPWLMENVIPRLIPTVPFSMKLNAFDYGDVTTRKRWFYSDHLLHVIPTPGARRFGDIRDHDADRIALAKRVGATERRLVYDDQPFPTFTEGGYSGVTGQFTVPTTPRRKGEPRGGRTMPAVYGRGDRAMETVPENGAFGSITQNFTKIATTAQHRLKVGQRSYPQAYTEIPEDSALGSVTSHTPNQPLVRGRGRKGNVAMEDGLAFGSFTGESNHRGGTLRVGQSRPTQDDDALTGFLKVGLRGHSASASAFDDDEPIGSLIANSWHGNELSRLGPSVRCPSLLEMARAHSLPDSFDWCGATKTARGKMIANSWPVGMATAVCRAMLVAMGAGARPLCHPRRSR